MKETHVISPSKEAVLTLNALRDAVALALDKKEKLGQYAVMWDGEKPVKSNKPMSE